MITYCTNIHPGESWDEIFANLQTYLLKVKAAVSPDTPFPIGLRLSNPASLEIDEKTSDIFSDWCRQHDCYVSSINGFPYGAFHASEIKEKVYLPDWRDTERVEYTKRLARLLDSWLPEKKRGSISTVPIGFRNHMSESDLDIVRSNLLNILEHLNTFKQKSGKEIILSLEPEPGCVLETTDNVLRFFEQMQFPEDVKGNIGICYDCCHQAVEFEGAGDSLSALAKAGIAVGKIQVSSALSFINPDYEILRKFQEKCYLHQVVIKREDGSLTRYNDLPQALRQHEKGPEDEWRIHFHVPVFLDSAYNYGTTRRFTEEIISMAGNNTLLEVETYTWEVLPSELRMEHVTDSIVREIKWVQSKVNEQNSST